MSDQSEYISRKLSWTDTEGDTLTIMDNQLFTKFSQPLVILGDPGMGKSRLMERLGNIDGCQFIRATAFLRQPDNSIPTDNTLVIDGLDEIAALEEGDPLHNVLKKLQACGKPRFAISCRSAEWRSVTGRLDISDDYHEPPQELTLQPLSEEDATNLLSRKIDKERGKEVIDLLKHAGLGDLFGNPLTLNLIITTVAANGSVPENRAILYDDAVAQLRLEKSDKHSHNALAQLSEDDALDAAGVAMAAMLITGQDSITKSQNSDGALSLYELSDLANVGTIKAVLGSNLFRADTTRPGLFLPFHRTIAEFLGARWLARIVEQKNYPNRVARRLFSLISAEGGVPASLRGLHAWLPKFSHERLGPMAIDRDPYGILRYGDGDNLTTKQARQIIQGLRQLAAFDPYFRTDWWHRISLKGLANQELLDAIRSIIRDKYEPFHLRSLIFEAINGSDIALPLKSDLEETMYDISCTYHERSEAAEAISRVDGIAFDWQTSLERLIDMSDEDSTRLALALFDVIGFETLSDELIVRAVVVDSGILTPQQGERHSRTFGPLYILARKLPIERVVHILDALTAIILPTRDPERWWDTVYHEGWTEFGHFSEHLIRRQLEHGAASVTPPQLWNWVRALEREHGVNQDDRKVISNAIRNDQRLRRGVQRLALFSPGTRNGFWSRINRLNRLSNALALTDEDVQLYLSELVARNDPAEREGWTALTGWFRDKNGVIPVDIHKIARPYAKDIPELKEFLTKKPRRPRLDEWEIKHRRNERARKRREEKTRTEARKNYTTHIDEVKRGEFKWIFNPARAFLGMFRDLDQESPAERIAEWLGEEVRDAALLGFEAVLHRNDLPSIKQIADSYAESRHWNFIFPMLAGAGHRHLTGRGFTDLPDELVSSLAIGIEHELLSGRQQFDGLTEVLEARLREDPAVYEAHLRQKLEPFIEARHKHIPGLYQFTRRDLERPLSTQLSLEWLERFSELPPEIELELAQCIINAPEQERNCAWIRLVKIAEKRLEKLDPSHDKVITWRSIQFLLDFDAVVSHIPPITPENRDWLWSITSNFSSHNDRESRSVPFSSRQLKWIVSTFRTVWPHTERPDGVTSGDTSPWDATRLLEWAMHQLAKDPSDEAAQALAELRDMPRDGYTLTAQASIATQYRTQLEDNFNSPSLAELKAVLADAPPRTAADVQAILLNELAELQKRLRGDALNLVNNFYDDNGKPRIENDCRDQMLIAFGELPFNIQSPPEVAMPQGNRSDAAFVYGNIAVPLETKGQWHKDVWIAAKTQLDSLYSVEHKSASKGIYVVFWFGLAAPQGRKLKPPPDGAPKPASAEEMCLALQTLLPSERRNDIAIVVLDLTRP